MKGNIRLLLSIWVAGQLLLGIYKTYGQNTVSMAKDRKQESKPLKTVLLTLEKKYKISFFYESKLIENKFIVTPIGAASTLEAELQQILSPLSLRFQKVRSQVYVILAEEKKQVTPVEPITDHLPSVNKEITNLNQYSSVIGKSELETIRIEKQVKGSITFGETASPLPGVSVTIKGTTKGTVTDANGVYNLPIPSTNTVLVFRFVGYETQEVSVGARTVVDIEMVEDVKALQEVVVVGYGFQTRRDLTGAISSIKSEAIMQQPITSVEQAPQGLTSGVQVIHNSGKPNMSVTIRIRGTGTVNSSDPLTVVDGIPLSTGSMKSINPNDVEAIEILKDASATAIYGARAANGVVMITTKRGTPGKTRFSLDSYAGIQHSWHRIPLLDAENYAKVNNEARHNANLYRSATQQLRLNPAFTDPALLGKGTDWLDAIFRTGSIQSHQLTISGGNEKSTFAISGNYFNNQGIIIHSGFQRLSFRVNSDHKLSRRLAMGNTLLLSGTREEPQVDNDEFNGLLSTAMRQEPTLPVRLPDGSFAGPTGNFSADARNPVQQAELEDVINKSLHVLGNAYAEYEFITGLRFRSTFNLELNVSTEDNYNPVYETGNRKNLTSSLYRSYSTGISLTWDNVASYTHVFNQIHNLTVTGGVSAQDVKTEFISASTFDFRSDDPSMRVLSAGIGVQKNYGDLWEVSLVGYLGRVNYVVKNKYLVTASFRVDGSSRFGKGNKYGAFPSGSIGWRITEEPFMAILPFLTEVKLRASWGRMGNQNINNYDFAQTLTSNLTYTLGDDQKRVTGIAPTMLANTDIQWETTTQTDAGVDFSLFKNHLFGTIDLFNKKTTDMLVYLPVHGSSGYTSAAPVNAGTVRNWGLEFALGYQFKKSDFSFRINGNASTIRNKVLSLGGGEPIVHGNTRAGDLAKTEVGRPISSFYGYRVAGIFQNQDEIDRYARQPGAVPGDFRFVDLNNDGRITEEDRSYLGSPFPAITLGLQTAITFKKFDFNLLFTGVLGNKVANSNKYYLESGSNAYNKSKYILNRWTGPGTSNETPRLTWDDPNNNTRASSWYIEDGSYIRVKNVQLGYSLSKKTLSFMGLTRMRVYISSQNLFTFTAYQGWDPEVGRPENSLDLGIDKALYPQARSFIAGLNIDF